MTSKSNKKQNNNDAISGGSLFKRFGLLKKKSSTATASTTNNDDDDENEDIDTTFTIEDQDAQASPSAQHHGKTPSKETFLFDVMDLGGGDALRRRLQRGGAGGRRPGMRAGTTPRDYHAVPARR